MSNDTSGGRVGSPLPGRPPTAPGGKQARLPARPACIRLAAFDLDGTLMGPEHVIADETAAALAALKASGVEVIIITGRMHASAERYAWQLGLAGKPLVSFNGAMVKVVGPEPGAGEAPPPPPSGAVDAPRSAVAGGLTVVATGTGASDSAPSDLWWHRPLAAELALEVLAFLRERQLDPLFFAGDDLFAGAPGDWLAIYQAISGIAPKHVDDLSGLVREGLCPTKLLQVRSAEVMPALLAEAGGRFSGVLHVTTSYPFFLEFMDKTVSKGNALAEVCRRLGVAREETAAFGDGMNDLDMIEWAGLGVAMGHGPERLVEAADDVAYGAPGEGVAGYIREKLLRSSLSGTRPGSHRGSR